MEIERQLRGLFQSGRQDGGKNGEKYTELSKSQDVSIELTGLANGLGKEE